MKNVFNRIKDRIGTEWSSALFFAAQTQRKG